jgi:NTP pyrophosphatase (non-canonical NTP hydrolase)
MNLNEFQERAGKTDQNAAKDAPAEDKSNVIPMLGMAGEVGTLLSEYKKLLRDGHVHRRFKDAVSEELGDILWYVANVATKFDLNLDDVVRDNLEKVEDRWIARQGQRRFYDEDFPPHEQLPREFEFSFTYRDVGGARKIVLLGPNGEHAAGDPITDNAYEDDGYRFHDVMHLALAAVLGWSPVTRKIWRPNSLKRKSKPKIDEVEDGGRAQVIEEAIVAAAYVYAVDHNFMDGKDNVDWDLLLHIKRLTVNVEVRDRTTWEWNKALIEGFRVWRELRKHDGGRVKGNLREGTLKFAGK